MKTISSTLAAAAVAENRAPICRVSYADYGISLTALISGTCPYALKRFDIGTNFYAVTAYDYTNMVIYQKTFSAAETASNWTSGYTSVSTVGSQDGVQNHDMMVLGARILIVYEKSNGIIYARQSNDSGSSFGSEYQVANTGYSWAHYVSIADFRTIFVAATENYWNIGGRMMKYTRADDTTTTWSASTPAVWDWDQGYLNSAMDSLGEGNSWNWRQVSDIFYGGIGGTGAGFAGDRVQQPFYVENMGGLYYGPFNAFGFYNPVSPTTTLAETSVTVQGLSRMLNDYYFTMLNERYIESVDKFGLANSDYSYRWHLCKTKDLKSFHVVPLEYISPYTKANLCGVAITESADYICMPVTYGTTGASSYVYLIPKTGFFGYDSTYTDITGDAVETISIDSSSEQATKASVSLTCAKTDYADVIGPRSIVKIEAGYTTSAGNEYQQRFSGRILDTSKTVDNETLAVNLLDQLAYSTAVKQGRNYLFTGQNVFHATFDTEDEMELFVQSGTADWWYNSSTGMAEVRTIPGRIDSWRMIAGYEPEDNLIVSAKFRVAGALLEGMAFGVVFDHGTWGGIEESKCFCIRRYAAGDRYEYLTYTKVGGAPPYITVRGYSTTFTLLTDTDYWLQAVYSHGVLTARHSDDGIIWSTIGLTTTPGYQYRYKGYAGVFAYSGTTAGGTYIGVDNIDILSTHAPQSGSDVMEHLAAISNLETNEDMQISDEFAGSSFSSRWDAGSAIGTWSVSGGYAQGWSASPPCLMRCDFTTSDVIVTAVVDPNSTLPGVFARASSDLSDCYALSTDGTYSRIWKKIDGAWTQLTQAVSYTYPSDYCKMQLVVRGHYIAGFMNGELSVYAYDETLTEGYCGLYTGAWDSGSKGMISIFEIDGFYTPVDVVVIKPGDTVGSIMSQIASMYTNSYFFCDVDGKLKWGTKKEGSSTSLDVRQIIGTMTSVKSYSDILTQVRIVGADCFADVRDEAWAMALLGHRYSSIEQKEIGDRLAAEKAGQVALSESQKILINDIVIAGNPALEIGDTIRLAEYKSETGSTRVVKVISEAIRHGIYEMTLSDLRPDTEEAP